jgi:predicted XRE-type DNA-binding protein
LDAEVLDDEARFKLAIMKVIDRDLRERFRTLEEAADHANVGFTRISRLRNGHHDQFSIGWLFRLAKDAGVRIRINVD